MLTWQLSGFAHSQGKLCIRVRSGIRTLFATSPDLDPALSETGFALSTLNSIGRHFPSQTMLFKRARQPLYS